MLIIKKTKKYGRGVFSKTKISKGKLIEVSPLIVISKKKESDSIMNTMLGSYVYFFEKHKIAIAGGFGSFFNHSEENNLKWVIDHKKQTIRYYAIRDIKEGEQLFLNYGYKP